MYVFFLKISTTGKLSAVTPLHTFCLKNTVNDIFPEPKFDPLLSRLITFIW